MAHLWLWSKVWFIILVSRTPIIVSRVQLPKCRLWIYYGGFNEPIQLGIQAPQALKKFWNLTNDKDILRPYDLDIFYDTSQVSHPPFHTQRRDHIWISIPSWIIRRRQPGHSFRPYTEKELSFPVPNEKCFYTPNSDLMSLYSILF